MSSDWWLRHVPTSPDWWTNYAGGDWWMVPRADEFGPDFNTGVGFMEVGVSFDIGEIPLGDAAVATTFIVS